MVSDHFIHPTAIIEEGAVLGRDVTVGPYSVVGKDVSLADNITLKSHVVIEGHTYIGEGSVIYPFASLGSKPQDLKYDGEESQLIIGKNNTIREHVTMNPGTKAGEMKTIIGDDGLFMVGVHVAHDCVIGNGVIMANNATLGGHVIVGDHALIGGLAAVHQFVRIGSFAVIGGMSGVENDVIPFGRVKGDRASLAGLNLVGLERGGFDKKQIRQLQKAVHMIFEGEDNFEGRLENVANEFGDDLNVQSVVDFARNKRKFGLCQPGKKNVA